MAAVFELITEILFHHDRNNVEVCPITSVKFRKFDELLVGPDTGHIPGLGFGCFTFRIKLFLEFFDKLISLL